MVFLTGVCAKTAFGQSLSLLDQYEHLGSHPEWLNMLHVKNGESEIDDRGFFFAPNGKHDARSELRASLSALMNDQTDTDDSVYCRFPSRSTWLLDNVPGLASRINLPACRKNREELTKLNAQAVTLVLASAHINSPASAFGHTFLRIDARKNTPLTSYAVSYAAATNETNGLLFAYKGLSGGYEGRYAIQPYFEMLKEYSDLEHRDVWEYPMNFDDKEITRLVNHLLEIRHFYSDYYFFTENCSYNLLWALQVARPGLTLTDQFSFSAIPIDTVRAIAGAGLIQEQIYRPSSRKKMVKLAENLKQVQGRTFVNNTHYDMALLTTLDEVEKISALELATFELKNRRSKQVVDNDTYTRDLLHLLKARSKLATPVQVDISMPAPPVDGHLSKRLNLGMVHRNQYGGKKFAGIGFKPAYHDVYDHEYGFLPGAYISFGDMQLIADKETLKLDSLSLIDIRSYAMQDVVFKPVSWQVMLGTRRVFDDQQHVSLKVGGGVTLGNDSFYGFVMAMPGAYLYPKVRASGTLQTGVIATAWLIKLGVQLSHEQFQGGKTQRMSEGFMTFQLTSELALNLKYVRNQLRHERLQRSTSLNMFYYF